MRNFLLSTSMLVILVSSSVYAQNVVITDDSTYSANPSAMLDVKSNTKGFLMPRTIRDSISNPAKGLMIYDTAAVKFYFFDGSVWIDLATISGGDSIWLENTTDSLVYLNNSFNKVGIGVDTPFAKLDVMGDTVFNNSDTIPLFVVRDKDGKEVFVVYPKGVRVYVDTLGSGSKATTNEELTGFRVGRKTTGSTKGFDEEYFTISPAPEADTTSSVARVLWYPEKEAFMAGRVIVEDADSVGLNSWASGFESRALGNYSQALGYQSSARGHYSTAIGYESVADGDYSIAIGDSSWAGGGGGAKGTADNCYAFGKRAEAKGDGSYAFGRYALSSGNGSFALGDSTSSTKNNSFAFGRYTHALGISSFSMGDNAIAGTDTTGNAYAFGKGSKASGDMSYAFGFESVASGPQSFALGERDSATGPYSYALGIETKATNENSFAMGAYSIANGSSAFALGHQCLAEGERSLAVGDDSKAFENSSVALGKAAEAHGMYSFAVGYESIVNGRGSAAIGYSSVTQSDYSYAFGYNCVADSSYSFAIGKSNSAKGWYSHAYGTSNTAYSAYETVVGRGCESYTPNSKTSWNTSDRLFVVGNGNGTTKSNALTILKNGNVGIGYSSPSNRLEINGTALCNYTFQINAPGGTEGGELQLQGGSGNPTWSIDEAGGMLRFHESGQVPLYIESGDHEVHIQSRLIPDQRYSNNALPIAYGVISSGGSVSSGTSNISSVWSSDHYEITISGESYSMYTYVTTVSPSGSNLTSQVSSVGGKLYVKFYNSSGTATQTYFNFITFKP